MGAQGIPDAAHGLNQGRRLPELLTQRRHMYVDRAVRDDGGGSQDSVDELLPTQYARPLLAVKSAKVSSSSRR